jgi:lysyl-tRNA synthetase class 2
MELYLRIAPELYLKRLVVGNLERVYEVARCFRNEGISPRHNPEFTQIEAYMAYADYRDMMDLVEGLVCAMAEAVNGTLKFERDGVAIDLTPPWRRVPLLDALKQETGVDFGPLETDDQAREACKGLELPGIEDATLTQIIDRAFDRYIKDRTDQPTFVTDYPVAVSPLAKRCEHDPALAQRFEPVVAREELGNAFSELNDPLDQRRRFDAQVAAHQAGDEEAHPLDEDFLRALEYGLPPTGGLGIGIDRLLMILTDAGNLRETVYFPLMRPE